MSEDGPRCLHPGGECLNYRDLVALLDIMVNDYDEIRQSIMDMSPGTVGVAQKQYSDLLALDETMNQFCSSHYAPTQLVNRVYCTLSLYRQLTIYVNQGALY